MKENVEKLRELEKDLLDIKNAFHYCKRKLELAFEELLEGKKLSLLFNSAEVFKICETYEVKTDIVLKMLQDVRKELEEEKE